MSISLDSFTYPSISSPFDSAPAISSKINTPDAIINGSPGGAIPLALLVIIVIIIAYYILFASLGSDNSNANANNSGEGAGNNLMKLLLWGLFVFLILLNGVSYIFGVDIIASIKNIFSPVTTLDIKVKEKGFGLLSSGQGSGGLIKKQEVFHVSDNKYMILMISDFILTLKIN